MIIYKSDDTQRADVTLDLSTVKKHSLLGEHLVNVNVTLDSYVDFSLGDYLTFEGVKYTVGKQPVANKIKTNQFQYNIDFYAPQYDYDNALYMLDGSTEFFLNGDLIQFIGLIVTNMNRVVAGTPYSAGTVAATGYRQMSFSNDSCLSALQKVCTEFEMEYQFSDDGLTISADNSFGNATALTFEYKAGLRNIERKQLNDGIFVTRLYPFGGQRNTDITTYGHDRLRIAGANKYLENNVGVFGVIEKSKIWDEIYPSRTGTVTAVDGGNVLLWTDNTMDFDLNNQLGPSTAKVTFNTGLLAGYEFEISNYDHGTMTFTIVDITDDINQTLPNATLKPAIGDEYVLHDIIMPQTYIDAAEAELESVAQTFLNEYSSPNVVYDIKLDPVYFRTNLISLGVGDLIDITDSDFGITISTKVISIEQSLANPYNLSIRVGNNATISFLTRIILGLGSNTVAIKKEKLDRTAQYLRNRNRLNDLNTIVDTIFDPNDDQYFDSSKIKPLSIETAALSVGAKPLNMSFEGLEIEANYNSDANQLRVSASDLVHFTIEDSPRTWTVVANSFSIVDNDLRYLYAKVVDTVGQTGGVWELDTAPRTINSEAGYYNFLVGVVHAVQGTTRGVSMLYGQTFINGRFITTGRIQSLDTLSYFDLDTNQFFIGDGSSSLDWNVTAANQLTIKGTLVQGPSGDAFAAIVYRGAYDNGTTYYQGDNVTYQGTSWLYVNATASAGNVPADNVYWDVYAETGSDGADGVDGSGVAIKGTEADGTAIQALAGPHTEGDMYIAADTGNGWVWDGSQFNDVGPIRGPEGPQGAQGNQGVAGPAGADGTPRYTWIKYADSPTSGMSDSATNKEYIGLAYNKTTPTESTDYNDYEWALFLGPQGIQGGVGADGVTYYTWIKYADSPTNGMSDNPAGKQYLGISYNNASQTESTDYADYSWSLIQGETGPQGPQGPQGNQGLTGSAGADGQDGASLYTWVKYADTPTTGMNDSPVNKDYIGIAYNKSTPTESTNYNDYTWSLYKGDQGVQGPAGADGTERYTWIKYADTPTTGMSDNPSNKDYLGISYNNTSATESTDYNDYSWSLIIGPQGDTGATGPQGAAGIDGIDGADGADGSDGIDAVGTIPESIAPALFGGEADFTYTLDASAGGSTDVGEVRIQGSRFIKPDGSQADIDDEFDTHVITPLGEGSAGIWYIVWTDALCHTRVSGTPNAVDNNFMAVTHNGTTWVMRGNTGQSYTITGGLLSSDVFLCAIEAKATSGGLTGFVAFHSGATGLDALDPANYFDSFDKYINESAFLRNWYSHEGSGEITFGTTNPYGAGRYLQIGNGSGSDGRWMVGTNLIPYNPEDLYSVTFTCAEIVNGGLVYAGIQGWDANKNPVNVDGTQSYSSQHYIAADGDNLTTGVVTTFKGYFRGLSSSGNGVKSPNPAEPATLHEDVRYISPMFVVNYNNQSGIVKVYYQSIRKVSDFSPIPRGVFSYAVQYYIGDVVAFLGGSYIAKSDVIGIDPNNTTYWLQIAEKGDDGTDGTDGSSGPGIVFRGDFVQGQADFYYNNAERRDVVKYSGTYYFYNGADGTNTNWFAPNWASFGAQFSSVATDTLLSENANLADWIISDGKIQSQDGATTLYGPSGRILMNGVSVDGDDDTTRITPEIVLVTSDGDWADRTTTTYNDITGLPVTAQTSGKLASLAGKIKANSIWPAAGVYGKAENTGSGAAYAIYADGRAYLNGGSLSERNELGPTYLNNEMATSGSGRFVGLAKNFQVEGTFQWRPIRISGTLNLQGSIYNYIVATSTLTVNMPTTKLSGMTYYVKRQTSTVTLSASGQNFYHNSVEGSTMVLSTNGIAYMVTWDGTYWQVIIMNN